METTVSQDRETNIGLITDGYAAFGRGDMEGVARLFHPDMVWHALRLGQLSGDKVGRDAFFAFIGKTMELTQGSFSITPLEILASDTTGAVVCRSRAQRNGQELDDQQVHLYRLRDGQVVEAWQYTGPSADDFWA